MYFLTSFLCFYVGLKKSLSTIRYILDTYLFSNFVTMSFYYYFCRVLVQNLKLCIFCWYIYVFHTKTHSSGYSDHTAVLFISTGPFEDTQFPLP